MLIDLMETENSGKLHEVGARLHNAQTWIKDANGGCPGRSIWWHVEYGTTGLRAKGTTTRQQKPRDSCSCRSRATIVEKQAFGGP
ncbi:Valine--tRNA ligase [Trichinella spiralis]|uniref:Valine--tRNA ligase n=1 Tax=Trichinella spiralis TaxID=6334 RepID=A0ABR3KUD5_TRISP